MMEHKHAIYQIYNTKFEVQYADITAIPSDAIVSSDSNCLNMGGGVSASILKAAGDILREEVRKHVPAKLGDVIVTSAGKLATRYIFHGITIDVDRRCLLDESDIKSIVKKSLMLAELLGVKRISYPALGTGVARLSFQVAANAMTSTITDHLSKGSNIEVVTLCLFAREGIKDSDLNLFYEQSAGWMALAAQNNNLNILLGEMRPLVHGASHNGLEAELVALQNTICDITNKIVNIASHENSYSDENPNSANLLKSLQTAIQTYTDKVDLPSSNQALANKWLESKLSGLYALLNIKQISLNRHQLQEAKYGLMLPEHIKWTILDLQDEMKKIERQITHLKTEIDP